MAMPSPGSAAVPPDPVAWALPDPIDGLAAAACLFHGFSDRHRIGILRHLALGEHRVVDLTAHLGLAQSTVSKHLACLRDCGLVAARPQGRATYYSLTHPEALQRLWGAAERLLALTGARVILCDTHGLKALAAEHPDGGSR